MQYKDDEVTLQTTEYRVTDRFVCCVLPALQPVVLSCLDRLNALQLLKQIAAALDFLYGELQLCVLDVDEASLAYDPAACKYKFVGYEQLVRGQGPPDTQAVERLTSLVARKLPGSVEVVCMSPSRYLRSDVFDNPVFRTVNEITEPGRLHDEVYLRQLVAIFKKVSIEMLFQGLVPRILA